MDKLKCVEKKNKNNMNYQKRKEGEGTLITRRQEKT